MIDIWLLHHSAHGVLGRPVDKLVVAVLIPDLLEVKVGPAHVPLEQVQVARVREGLGGVAKGWLEGGSKGVAGGPRVVVRSESFRADRRRARLAGDVVDRGH